MTLSSEDVGGDFLRFRQRSDPLVIIELFRGWVLFLLQEHELRVEEESALFQQVSCRPLDCENNESPKQAPPLAASSEGDNGVELRNAFWEQPLSPVLNHKQHEAEGSEPQFAMGNKGVTLSLSFRCESAPTKARPGCETCSKKMRSLMRPSNMKTSL